MKYSVVVPVYNEEGNVVTLHQDIVTAMESLGAAYEIIFIDDGSSDRTLQRMHDLSPLVSVELRKNFGQTAAMDAGIKAARGEFVITLDGDGQNPPSEIPKLIQTLEAGNYDVVSGWRKKRNDPFLKRYISKGAHLLRNIFVKDEIHDSGCSLKIYKRECFENVDLFGEMHRFIPAILSWSGYKIGEVEVLHQPRVHGASKYNWKRVIKGFIDMLSIWFWRKFANRPLHLFGSLSILMTLSGTALLIYLFIKRVIIQVSLADSNMPLLAALLIILGIQFFVSGIMIDILIKQYYSGGRSFYSIRKVNRQEKNSSHGNEESDVEAAV